MDGAFGIIFSNNYKEVLLVKRRDIPIWVLPGGALEKNETPFHAVIREVFEETGYNVKLIRQVGQYTYPNGRDKDCSYECTIESGIKTLSNESGAIEFFEVNCLPKLTYPYDTIFINDALLKNKSVIVKNLNKLPLSIWIKGIKHPFVLFKYLLTKIGIHWNT